VSGDTKGHGETVGLVCLVGAGPGDPGLITVAGLDRVRRAEVLVYDRLVAPSLIAEASDDVELIDASKSPDHHTLSQEAIGRVLVDRARAGKFVVRLKGGDPFVFGRGGEEAEELAQAGLEFEVIPGITSAIAAPAYAGIPVTQRGLASSFAVITGHEDDAKTESTIDWSGIAHGADTLLFLMGRRSLPEIAERLIAEGRAPTTPAAAVQWGTLPKQRSVRATLATLPAAVEAAGLDAPVVIVVGSVVELSERIGWYERRPLFGKRVLVTRTRQQAGVLAERLRARGAEAIELPAIEIVPADVAPITASISRMAAGHYDWAIFTSANGVREYFRHLETMRLDARAFGTARVAAIGSETERALQAFGIRADVVPERFVAESLVDALAVVPMSGTRVLLARAAGARDVLPAALRERGADVDDVPLYQSQRPAHVAEEALVHLSSGEIDVATFTSSSTVKGCLALVDGQTDLLSDVVVACIGPITAKAARDAGLNVAVVSETHTVAGLVDALEEHFRESVTPRKAVVHARD
jgi:uroporphyrinogen III methyltransferase/synthase